MNSETGGFEKIMNLDRFLMKLLFFNKERDLDSSAFSFCLRNSKNVIFNFFFAVDSFKLEL